MLRQYQSDLKAGGFEVLFEGNGKGDEQSTLDDGLKAGLVQDMLTTGQHGFRLSLQTELPYRMLILASAEDSDPARRPLLEVDYQSGVGVWEAGSALQEFTTLWQGTNALLVRSSRQHSAATIDVMDTGGRVVLSVPLNGSSTLMNTTNWLPGVYLIALRDGDSQSIRRVVKED